MSRFGSKEDLETHVLAEYPLGAVRKSLGASSLVRSLCGVVRGRG